MLTSEILIPVISLPVKPDFVSSYDVFSLSVLVPEVLSSDKLVFGSACSTGGLHAAKLLKGDS